MSEPSPPIPPTEDTRIPAEFREWARQQFREEDFLRELKRCKWKAASRSRTFLTSWCGK